MPAQTQEQNMQLMMQLIQMKQQSNNEQQQRQLQEQGIRASGMSQLIQAARDSADPNTAVALAHWGAANGLGDQGTILRTLSLIQPSKEAATMYHAQHGLTSMDDPNANPIDKEIALSTFLGTTPAGRATDQTHLDLINRFNKNSSDQSKNDLATAAATKEFAGEGVGDYAKQNFESGLLHDAQGLTSPNFRSYLAHGLALAVAGEGTPGQANVDMFKAGLDQKDVGRMVATETGMLPTAGQQLSEKNTTERMLLQMQHQQDQEDNQYQLMKLRMARQDHFTPADIPKFEAAQSAAFRNLQAAKKGGVTQAEINRLESDYNNIGAALSDLYKKAGIQTPAPVTGDQGGDSWFHSFMSQFQPVPATP